RPKGSRRPGAQTFSRAQSADADGSPDMHRRAAAGTGRIGNRAKRGKIRRAARGLNGMQPAVQSALFAGNVPGGGRSPPVMGDHRLPTLMIQESRMLHFGFVLEQTLGHVTHAKNLARRVAEDADICPTWLPVEPERADRWARVPGVRGNWSLTASLR